MVLSITIILARSVTAAHCYQTRVTAVAGAHNISLNENTQQKMRKMSKYYDRNTIVYGPFFLIFILRQTRSSLKKCLSICESSKL